MEPRNGGCLGAGGQSFDGRSGFTLVEVMIAVCILSIGILGVCSMQISGLTGNAAARQYTDYATLAMEEMEMLMAMPYSSLPADGGTTGQAGLFATTDSTADLVIPGGDYDVYVNVAPNALMNNTTTVAVTVIWNSGHLGVTGRSVSLQGVIPQVVTGS
jgi:prepilin-type N-terminal cleavage/methylation domain-containing protein